MEAPILFSQEEIYICQPGQPKGGIPLAKVRYLTVITFDFLTSFELLRITHVF